MSLLAASSELDSLTGEYTNALRTLFPERAFFPDANSTLRLTYGKVEGSSPYDGMTYLPFTTANGILQKYVPGDADFDLPADLVKALLSNLPIIEDMKSRRIGKEPTPLAAAEVKYLRL